MQGARCRTPVPCTLTLHLCSTVRPVRITFSGILIAAALVISTSAAETLSIGACGARRPVRRSSSPSRSHRHRQRAGRPDVDGPAPRLLEPVRRRGPRRDDVHVDAEPRETRRHSIRHRRLRAGSAEPVEARGRVPRRSALRSVVSSGQPGYGMAAAGAGKLSEGSAAIVRAVDKADVRPLWIAAWGGTNTLAQALIDVRAHARQPRSMRSSRRSASTRSPIRTMRARGSGVSSRRSSTSSRHPRRTASSTTWRRGPASAAIGFTATRLAPTSRRSATTG